MTLSIASIVASLTVSLATGTRLDDDKDLLSFDLEEPLLDFLSFLLFFLLLLLDLLDFPDELLLGQMMLPLSVSATKTKELIWFGGSLAIAMATDRLSVVDEHSWF